MLSQGFLTAQRSCEGEGVKVWEEPKDLEKPFWGKESTDVRNGAGDNTRTQLNTTWYFISGRHMLCDEMCIITLRETQYPNNCNSSRNVKMCSVQKQYICNYSNIMAFGIKQSLCLVATSSNIRGHLINKTTGAPIWSRGSRGAGAQPEWFWGLKHGLQLRMHLHCRKRIHRHSINRILEAKILCYSVFVFRQIASSHKPGFPYCLCTHSSLWI